MFKDIKDNFINMVTSRLFVLVLIFLAMGSVLIYRIFNLQIVNGEDYLNNFTLRIQKERIIPSTRGNIYDRNGKLLAYNELAYTVKIEDVYESGNTKNAELNKTILDLIRIIEGNGDKIINDFNIILNDNNQFEFAVSDTALLRFLADVYGHTTIDKLKDNYAQLTSTPEDVVNYLADASKFGIGERTDPNDKKSFQVGLGYTKEELLKVLTVRYAMSANSYQKFIGTTVATEVSEETVAVIMENSTSLEGVSIAEDTIRKYVDSVYFSHIIGYTGNISSKELEDLKVTAESEGTDFPYTINDVIGKAGIEKVMETDLKGINGSELVYVDKLGKTIDTRDRVEPVAGNDLYLTIDAELQKAVYNILEQKIAGLLVSKIINAKEYIHPENALASKIKIPITDVYFALINNNIINRNNMQSPHAKETEKEVYASYLNKKEVVLNRLEEELLTTKTPYNKLTKEYQVYESYITSMLKNVLLENKIDTKDETYLAWKTEETISLNEYLMHAIAMNWVDITKLELPSRYSDTEEIYQALVKYILDTLDNDNEFSKKLYKYMLLDNSLTGKQVCLLLWEQNIIDIPSEEIEKLKKGSITPYTFMLQRIENLDITPGQLALDPCSGSCVITDVNTGEVLALVSYPSYDNNRLANSVDAEYFKQINTDLSRPMWDYATQQRTAPGSTFKMVSAAAILEEGIVRHGEKITCLGFFDKINPAPKCWIYPNGTHGPMSVSDAIANSCNYFFYESAYRMGQDGDGYNSELGLQTLAKYANMFGLSDTSGVEIMESVPKVSDELAVPSAIGQGTHNYTTAGLARYVTTVANSGTCYNLSLIDKVTDINGALVTDYTPEIRNQVELSESTWNAIHTGMRKVIESKAYYSNLGVQVAGKTGTAEESKSRPNHSLFVGYAPYENPEIGVATRIAYGYTSNYAAEVTKDVFAYYYGLAEEEDLLSGVASRPESSDADREY